MEKIKTRTFLTVSGTQIDEFRDKGGNDYWITVTGHDVVIEVFPNTNIGRILKNRWGAHNVDVDVLEFRASVAQHITQFFGAVPR